MFNADDSKKYVELQTVISEKGLHKGSFQMDSKSNLTSLALNFVSLL